MPSHLPCLAKSVPFGDGLQLHFPGLLLSCTGHRGPLEIHPHAGLVPRALSCPAQGVAGPDRAESHFVTGKSFMAPASCSLNPFLPPL